MPVQQTIENMEIEKIIQYLAQFPDDLEIVYKRSNTAVKFLDEETGRVGGYLIVWGNEQQKDLTGEFFTPETELELDWYDRRPILYHHGGDGKLKSYRIGTIDTLKADDTGIWAEGQLDMHHRYVQRVLELVKKGILAWSSGALPQAVEKLVNGLIKRWPIVEGSLTPTPAEPFRTTVSAIKSALLDDDDQPEGQIAKGGETPTPASAPTATHRFPEVQTTKSEASKMDPIQMLKLALQAIMEATGAQLSEEEMATALQRGQELLNQQSQGGGEGGAQASANGQAAAGANGGGAPQTITLEIAARKAIATPEFMNSLQAIVTETIKARETAVDDFKKSLTGIIGSAPGISRVGSQSTTPANGGGQPLVHPNGAPVQPPVQRIEVFTPYNHLSSEDMSYFVTMKNYMRIRQGRRPWEPPQTFYREFAEKTLKEFGNNQVRLEEDAHKFVSAIKSDELNYSTLATGGDEYVPDHWSTQIWEKARLDNVILPLFQVVEMPTNPFELPVEGADATVSFVPETANENQLALDVATNPIPDSKIGTSKVTLTAKKLALRVGFSSELVEDSIIAIVSLQRQKAIRAIEDSIDNVLLNGDTDGSASANINLIDGTPAATAKYLALNGIRKLWLVTNTANGVDGTGAAASLAVIRSARFKLDRAYSPNPKDLAIITHTENYAKFLNMPEFITMDKAGSLATALTGQIGFADGMPVLVSNEFPLTNAAGKVPGAGGTLGSFAIAYKPGWYVGYRRRVNVSVDYLPYYDSYQLTATVRLAFTGRDNEVAAGAYNLLV